MLAMRNQSFLAHITCIHVLCSIKVTNTGKRSEFVQCTINYMLARNHGKLCHSCNMSMFLVEFLTDFKVLCMSKIVERRVNSELSLKGSPCARMGDYLHILRFIFITLHAGK